MIQDFNQLTTSKLDTDICIIGGGAAGISLALELEAANFSVMLIESGGESFTQDTQALYKGITTGVPYFDLDTVRLRYLGGTTNHWTGWNTPFTPFDFEAKDWVEHSGWPISFQDVEPFYATAGKYLGIEPFNNMSTYWHGIGKKPPFSPSKEALDYIYWQFSEYPKMRMGDHYKARLASSKNIKVLLNANLTQIIENQTTNHIESIELSSLGGKQLNLNSKFFVLAAGGIENARLLLASNRIQPGGIGNQNDQVGRYFMEHPHLDSALVVPTDKIGDSKIQSYLEMKYERYPIHEKIPASPGFMPSPFAQKKHKILNCAIQIRREKRFSDPASGVKAAQELMQDLREGKMPEDILVKVGRMLKDIGDTSGFIYDKMTKSHTKPELAEVYVIGLRSEQAPNPLSRVTLSDTLDQLNMPKTELHWNLKDIDKRTIKVSTDLITAELSRLNIARCKIDEWVLNQDINDLGRNFAGGWHLMGTTRMSISPKSGVVDKDCKVHGYDNIFIAGSSVFTTGSGANPTYTLIALAARLANHLKSKT